MNFVSPETDERAATEDGRVIFEYWQWDEIEARFDIANGASAKTRFDAPGVLLCAFMPTLVWRRGLLFVERSRHTEAPITLPEDCLAGTLEMQGRAEFLVFDLKVLERNFRANLDYGNSTFVAIRAVSVTREAGPKKVLICSDAQSFDDLERIRPGNAALRKWIPKTAALNSDWPFDAIVFDGILYLGEDVTLDDSGLIKTRCEIDTVFVNNVAAPD